MNHLQVVAALVGIVDLAIALGYQIKGKYERATFALCWAILMMLVASR